ncbi:VOC family protein [Mesorhizobium australafricanum]|uniref:VOC family protein n=1 Tax=Mesorhizobium australafricanum TaxID=3072311 RepID=A0ABU4WX63_9HYPH|nr:VOC family protein [Mesorhizobium sp. VK3E]MDX8440657.1 VOC family protein [Mesorhizobium sp. VK3E]
MATVHPFLWFNLDAEEARDFYLSVFKNSRALGSIEFTDFVGGTNRTVPHAIFDFELEGQRFTALNAGGVPAFNERISLYIETRDQAETDYFWNALIAGGGSEQPCGWLKDKFGVFWQVIPSEALLLMNDPDRAKAGRARQAMYSMKKIILADIAAAHAGRA